MYGQRVGDFVFASNEIESRAVELETEFMREKLGRRLTREDHRIIGHKLEIWFFECPEAAALKPEA